MALIRHYKLDDNAASTTVVATVGANATSQRNTSLLAVGAGNGPGGALDDAGFTFSRVDGPDYVTGNNPTLSGTGTIALWFKTSDTTYSKYLFDVRDALNDGPLLFWNVGATNIQANHNSRAINSGASSYADGSWHHVLFGWTATTMALYVDGSLVDSLNPTSENISVTANLVIGGPSYSIADREWIGQLADVRLYDTNESSNVATIRNEAKPSASATISGTEAVGATLTASPSSNDSTVTWTYQWYRADDGVGTNEASIGSATSVTYVLQAADENKYIRVRVQATNTGGAGLVSDFAYSAYSGQIAASAAPTITSATITGTSQIGQTLTANVVTDPASGPTIAYRWQTASDGSGTGAADISGETASTLALTYADFGSLLDTGAYTRFGAIATNGSGSSAESFSAWQEVTAPSGSGVVVRIDQPVFIM